MPRLDQPRMVAEAMLRQPLGQMSDTIAPADPRLPAQVALQPPCVSDEVELVSRAPIAVTGLDS